MKRALIVLSVIIAMATAATAQDIANKTWTNGHCEYRVFPEGNTLLFHGFDWHEGGFGFALNKKTNGKMAILEIQNDSVSYYCFPEYIGGTVEYNVLNGQELLLIRNSKGALADILINDNLKDLLTSSVVCFLAGTYSGAGGKSYEFSADAPRASGFGDTKRYTVDALYYLPGFFIHFEEGKPYMITGNSRANANGLRLQVYSCIKDENDDWEPQEAGVLELTKIKWSSTDKTTPGRYPYTSARVMTRGELMHFTLDERDIMRNEIFARHGHIFKTARYRDYFNVQSWYKGTVNDATNLLSEIERLNVEQIIAVQEIVKKAN